MPCVINQLHGSAVKGVTEDGEDHRQADRPNRNVAFGPGYALRHDRLRLWAQLLVLALQFVDDELLVFLEIVQF